MDNLQAVMQRQRERARGRRAAVSAESVQPSHVHASQLPRLLPEAEEGYVLGLLQQVPVLSYLPREQLLMVAQAMERKTFPRGAVIIRQGDEGDFFYLLDRGSVAVYVKGSRRPVHAYSPGPGAAFGELALLYNAPRAASCVAETDVVTYALHGSAFKQLVVAANVEALETRNHFLMQVPILSQLTDAERFQITDCLRSRSFQPGEVVCEEDDEGDTFYIIESGEAIATRRGRGEVARLGRGEYFGEIALLTSKRRQATVTASEREPLKTLCMDRVTFNRVMGPLEIILRRSIEAYESIMMQSSNC